MITNQIHLTWNLTKTKFNNSLTFLHLNIQSITQTKANYLKSPQLESLISKYIPDIISLNETFLKPKNNFSIEGYNIFRTDRTNTKGGGSALCIKNNIKGSEILMNIDILNDNVTGFLLESVDKKIAIFSIYSPPKSKLNPKLFEYIKSNFDHFIILGDLNAKNKSWFCSCYCFTIIQTL